MTKAAAVDVPVDVLSELADHCVANFKYQQLAIVLEHWHLTTFSLSCSQDKFMDYCKTRQESEEIGYWSEERIRKSMRSKVLQTVMMKVALLHEEGKTNIQVLDLRNYPIGLSYLQKMILHVKGLSPLKIIVDLSLTEQDAKHAQHFDLPRNLSIVIRNLYFYLEMEAVLSHEDLVNYLQYLWTCFDLTQLESVQLSTIDLRRVFSDHGEVTIFQKLEKLLSSSEKLSNIDLSYNAININGDDGRSLRVLHKFLSAFPRLKRLDLSGNRMQNYLGALIKNNQELEYLNIGGTQLRQIDVSFLSTLKNLRHLDLSSNNLSNKLNVLKSALSSLKCLQILEMESCQLSDDCFLEIQPYLRKLPCLEALNVQFNNLRSASIQLTCIVFKNDDVEDWDSDD